MEVLISSIKPGRNPRQYFDPAAMEELENSIRVAGVLQPILVRPAGIDRYEIVAGERRWRAAKAVYGETGAIPAQVKEMTDAEADVAALIENTLRSDMSFTEEAEAAHSLLRKMGGDRIAVADALGWPQSKIYRRLALMEAIEPVRNALTNRAIVLGHAELLAAAPKDKQEKVLEKVIAGNISVSELKKQLASISHSLEAAIFDKSACGNCPHNSTLQAQMFSESLTSGNCTNPICYMEKLTIHVDAIVEAQRENFPRIELLKPGSAFESIPVVAEGHIGVGEAQFTSCKGCADYGCTVSMLPGQEGNIEEGVCFNAACHMGKVAENKKESSAEMATCQSDKVSKPGKATGSAKSRPKQNLVSQKIKDYRVKVWKKALEVEIAIDSITAASALIALSITGNARHINASGANLPIKSSDIGNAYKQAKPESGKTLSEYLTRLAVSAVHGMAERDVCRLLEAMEADLSQHWVMDAEYLDLMTISELESLATESGLEAAMGDNYKKALTGKKAEIIGKFLKVEGFNYRGIVPANMQYLNSKGDLPSIVESREGEEE
jgi:ParB family chromosome partitioning protein